MKLAFIFFSDGPEASKGGLKSQGVWKIDDYLVQGASGRSWPFMRDKYCLFGMVGSIYGNGFWLVWDVNMLFGRKTQCKMQHV